MSKQDKKKARLEKVIADAIASKPGGVVLSGLYVDSSGPAEMERLAAMTALATATAKNAKAIVAIAEGLQGGSIGVLINNTNPAATSFKPR